MARAKSSILEFPTDLAQAAPPLSALQTATPAQRLRRVFPKSSTERTSRTPLGQILLEMGEVEPGNLLKALALRQREDVRLGDILLTHGWVEEPALMAALARQWQVSVVDLMREHPDPRLIDALGAELCLAQAMVPWRQIGGQTVIATARPESFAALKSALPAKFAPYRMMLAPERDVHDSLLQRRQTALIRRAEVKVDPTESCRTHNEARAARIAGGFVVLTLLGLWFAPQAIFGLLFGWVMLTLIASMGLKLLAFTAEFRARRKVDAHPVPLHSPTTGPPPRLPIISMMVPLFRENDIAPRLVERLGRLNYPRELLDVILVAEQSDAITREALAHARLPRWMRIVTVPDGPIKTKPRALNYALSFCRGSVIGVWDAEDAPEPDQLHIVARHFAQAPREVACLQGVLDYYNPRTNWLSRCFTIEYATWFRMFLPGLARLGFVVPLGGTTLFFRRDALEKLGGWDAHNVTEDADLGVRLARHGYRTELIPAVTYEEANCRTIPWVKQRSRWLKGYAMTWSVHMRNPLQLWRDLGTKRFIGVQILILGSLSQYILAPVLWSFWITLFGLWHPIASNMPASLFWPMMALFVLSELLNIAAGMWSVRHEDHRHLIKWVPSLHLYFPLGALAGWKAIYEVITMPFYWDKTHHGIFDTAHIQSEQRSGPTPTSLIPAITKANAILTQPAPRTPRAPLID
ncbi:glycosyltransferase family 2 protein [Thioclava sp. 15-R06ZXC-3]|uniref:Glycosyltransferase family 2 protein n=1 Tax=Thioclava arctica TaxID=3238301 RepID=A0ABV3TLT5_9RHOB